MPIRQFLQGATLTPEELNKLNAAYQRALRMLGLVDRNDPIAEIVATKIIEVGKRATGDAASIAQTALSELGVKPQEQ